MKTVTCIILIAAILSLFACKPEQSDGKFTIHGYFIEPYQIFLDSEGKTEYMSMKLEIFTDKWKKVAEIKPDVFSRFSVKLEQGTYYVKGDVFHPSVILKVFENGLAETYNSNMIINNKKYIVESKSIDSNLGNGIEYDKFIEYNYDNDKLIQESTYKGGLDKSVPQSYVYTFLYDENDNLTSYTYDYITGDIQGSFRSEDELVEILYEENKIKTITKYINSLSTAGDISFKKTFTYNEKGDVITFIDENFGIEFGWEADTKTALYDDRGRILSYTYANNDWPGLNDHIVYTYEGDTLISKKRYDGLNEDAPLFQEETYEYNEKGDIVRISVTRPSSAVADITEYDYMYKNNKIIEKKMYSLVSNERILQYHEAYTYDKNGLLTSRMSDTLDINNFDTYCTMEYNDNRFLVKEICYNDVKENDEKIVSKEYNTYNSDNIILMSQYYSNYWDNEWGSTEVNIFDENNNKITMRSYDNFAADEAYLLLSVAYKYRNRDE